MVPLDFFYRPPNDRQCPQTKKVHFQQPQLFQKPRRILRIDLPVIRTQRHKIHNRSFADYNARRMCGGMARQSFQTFRCVNQPFRVLLIFVSLFQIRIHFHRRIYGDILPLYAGNHFGNTVRIGIGHCQRPPHILDNRTCRHRTECNNLRYMVLAIFFDNVVNDLLPPFIAEIHVNIRHTHAFRVQKPFKNQAVFDRVNRCDRKAVRNHAARCRTAPRSYADAMVLRVFDKIPHNQEIIHKAHVLNRVKFIFQTFFPLRLWLRVMPAEAFVTEFAQIAHSVFALRHVKLRQLQLMERERHVAAFCNFRRVLTRFRRIGKQPIHFLRAFHIKLPALIAHPVLVQYGFACLNTKQNVMRLRILLVNIMAVVCRNQRDSRFFAHAQQGAVNLLLLPHTMVL